MSLPFPLDPPPGFRGLHPFEPVESYTRHLPHWRQQGATYFVTFRLADSLPQEKLDELKRIKREWEADLKAREAAKKGALSDEEKKKAWESLARITIERTEHWLDQGMGACVLRGASARKIVIESLEYFDGDRYELASYVVMPNHAHVIIRPLGENPLESILRSVKRNSSREINRIHGTQGTLWQEESYDRIIRDAAHLSKCLQYIGENPGKAGLPVSQVTPWVRPEWESLGWRFLSAGPAS